MNTLIYLAEAWWPLYAIHMVEVSLFIMLVWAVDHWLTLETRLRYALYLLALAKVFVPPVLAIPIPAFLHSTAAVTVHEGVSSGVVSEAFDGSPGLVTPFPPAFYLFCLWVISVLVWTGVALWKNMAFRRTLKSAAPVDLASDVSSLSVPGNLKVYAKTDLPSPILVGLIRPRLFLPSKWSSWTSEELRGVVKHELAHFERRDIYVLILQAMATALFGANPLIWLLNRRLMYVRELRCDEAVLRETSLSPAEYGRLLLGLVDRRPMPSALTVFFADRGTTLKKRLEHVLSFKEGGIKRSKRQLAVLILVGLAIVPLSIREAYTQNERAIGALNPSGDGRGTELNQVQQTAPAVADNSDTVTVAVPMDDEADVKTKPVSIGQFKSTVILSDILAQFANSSMATEEGFDATVTLKVRVDADAWVGDVKVINVEGPAGFRNAVEDVVSRMRFKPAKRDSENVPVWFTQQISIHNYPSTKKIQTPNSTSLRDAGLGGTFASDQVDKKPRPSRIVSPDYPRAAAVEKLNRSADANIREIWSVDVKPAIIHSVQPYYPDVARRNRFTGIVHLKFKVNVDGSVSDVRARGRPIFVRPAIDAISQYRFTPARHEGKPVPVWMTRTIKFNPRKWLRERRRANGREEVTTDSNGFEGNQVFEISEVDVKPEITNSDAVRPNYPDSAKEAGLTGNVFLIFKINVDGSVSDVRVLRGDEVFHEPAIEAVRQLRYRPAEIGGKPVPVWMTQRIAFALPEQTGESISETSDPGAGN